MCHNRPTLCGSRLKSKRNCVHPLSILDGVPRVETTTPLSQQQISRQVRLCCFTRPDNIAAYMHDTAHIKNLFYLRDKFVYPKQPTRSVIPERQS